jgi:hypothetical protein
MSSAHASDDDLIKWLLQVEDYQEVYRLWSSDAFSGDSEKQELVADLLLGPHGKQVKHPPYQGIRYLYYAAVRGRPTAMLKLSKALDTGSFGAIKSPEAAACWAKAPADSRQRLACMAITNFSDHNIRLGCREIPFITDAVESAKLCLAYKTPALLVPGVPPGPEDMQRQREYARRGIDWIITGDVYEEEFERYRSRFNATIVEGIEKERGRGYLERVNKEIEARIARNRRKPSP